jgi:hypothetical protein
MLLFVAGWIAGLVTAPAAVAACFALEKRAQERELARISPRAAAMRAHRAAWAPPRSIAGGKRCLR